MDEEYQEELQWNGISSELFMEIIKIVRRRNNGSPKHEPLMQSSTGSTRGSADRREMAEADQVHIHI